MTFIKVSKGQYPKPWLSDFLQLLWKQRDTNLRLLTGAWSLHVLQLPRQQWTLHHRVVAGAWSLHVLQLSREHWILHLGIFATAWFHDVQPVWERWEPHLWIFPKKRLVNSLRLLFPASASLARDDWNNRKGY